MDKEKATLIFFLVIIAFLIMGIFVSDKDGYKRGYEEGYDNGYTIGHEEGYTDALSDYGMKDED